MTRYDDIEKIVQIARQYYEQNLTQDEIAANFGISRPTVSRMLKKALDDKIVFINIIDPYNKSTEYSDKLSQILQLKHCIVISGQVHDINITRRNIALAAAHYLADTIQAEDVVGLGWGRTLYELAESMEQQPGRDVLFVPMLGGIGQIKPSLQVHSIIQKVSDAFGGRWIQYYVPGIVDSKELREQLTQTANVQEMLGLWKRMNKAVVGIGETPVSSEIIFQDNVADIEKNGLVEHGAVGDICMRFFDRDGKPVNYMMQDIMSIELHELARVPEVIAIAGGDQKVDAIIGASKAKYINTLITDELTAQRILEKVKFSSIAHDN
ncbi:sugar-binding transcriptional regulator [Pelolinea submarina]|uniref:DNA-binding transcriptional regulator LsrR (DeoR family) n=1 Tax=Pelolinea submarina TaxID=913107 RepID=A0A347ZQV0_9CHLR|nr:sugar-binding transcriptional regulator [Pelolinea submarina]REG11764.1 DNA-binding transcriptional regulator LsrR (DeoR family) [Pelolinea submarina]BBB47681.1 DeoR family transcriptional regulator [Pelolinea submarina]